MSSSRPSSPPEDARLARLAGYGIARLAAILDRSFNEVYLFDPRTLAIGYANAGACRNLQLDEGQLRGLKLSDVQIWHSERLLQGVLDSLAPDGEDQVTVQIEHRRADGSAYPVEVRFQLFPEAQAPVGVAIANDIGEREAAMTELVESEERYRGLYQRTPALLFSLDAAGRLVNASDRWLEALGYAYEEVAGRRLAEFATDALRVHRVLERLMQSGGCRDEPLSFVRRDGEELETLLSASVERDRRGRPLRALAVLVDVTERNRAEAALRRSTAEFEAIFRSIPDAVAFMTTDRRIALVNPAFPRIMGYQAHEVIGRSAELLFEDPATYQRIDRARYRLDSQVDLRPIEVRYRRRDGECFVGETVTMPVRDDRGQTFGFLAITRDVSERVRMHEDLERAVREDPLTGVLHRGRFMNRLGHELRRARRHGRPLSLIVVDVDLLRRINDRHGHAAGDQVLRRIGSLLKRMQRDTDAVGRLGGEEFGLLLPETDLSGAIVVGERLQRAIAALRLAHRGARIDLTVSAGVVELEAGETTERLLARADEARHAAWRAGGNRALALDALATGRGDTG